MQGRTRGTLLVLAAAAGFGTLGIFGKLADAAGMTYATLLSFRFLAAVGIVWAAVVASDRPSRLSGRDRRIALGLGLAYATLTGGYFWGLEFLTAGLVSIVLYTYPVYVFVLSAAVLDEPVTARKVVALAVAFAGVAVILGADPAGADPRGVLVVTIAALAYAVYTTGSRRAVADAPPTTLAAYVLATSLVGVVLFGASTGRLSVPATAVQWGLVVGMAIVATAAPIFFLLAGLRHLEASRASVVSTFEPAVTVSLGAALLGEAVTPAVVAGGVLVVAAVVLIQDGEEPAPSRAGSPGD